VYKIYFKQAIEMLKQNKFISIITIIGTALAIMMIMVIIVTESIKNTSTPPELNRNRTMYLREHTKIGKETNYISSNNSGVMYNVYKTCLTDLQQPELVHLQQDVWKKSIVTTSENKMERKAMKLKLTDANIWKVMSIPFVEGEAFTETDVNSGLKKAVISESTAKALYGNTNALKKTIMIDFKPYTVIGIVKDVSPLFGYAHTDIYIPYTSRLGFETLSYIMLLLAKDKKDFKAIYEEIRSAERKYNTIDGEWDITFRGPYSHTVELINRKNGEPDIKGNRIKTILILAILLIIPAVNLSSFSISIIKKRTEEIGIRKAFGAKRYVILTQVLYENLVTSLIGGIIGLILSYIVVICLKQWLLGVEESAAVPLRTLVSLPIFLGVFTACILLNLLSSGIPAYKASRAKIVNSLNRNNS